MIEKMKNGIAKIGIIAIGLLILLRLGHINVKVYTKKRHTKSGVKNASKRRL